MTSNDSAQENRISRGDVIACVAIFFLCLGVRLATSSYIENGGDAVYKWLEVKRSLAGYGYHDWNHHTIRWALMLPVMVVQHAMGSSACMCYVFPILMSCFGSLVAYFLGRAAISRPAGWLCALGMILFPGMIRGGAQYLPNGPEAIWVISALLSLFLWQGNRKTRYLILSAAALFLGYGSKVTALYFLPGILIWLVFMQKDWRSAAVYLAVLAGLFAVETLAFYTLEGNPLGRLGILADSKHMQSAKVGKWSGALTTWEWLFCWKDYLLYSRCARYSIFLALAASACIFVLRKKSLYLLSTAYLSAFVFHTWTSISVAPFMLPQPRGERFQLALQVLGFLICIIFLASTPIRIKTAKGNAKSNSTAFLSLKRLHYAPAILIVLFFARYTNTIWLHQDAANSIWGVAADEKCLGEALKNGEAFAVIDERPRLHKHLVRIKFLYENTEDVAGFSYRSPQMVYPTQQGNIFVFDGDLAQDTLTAFKGIGFRRQHPAVLKLLEAKPQPDKTGNIETIGRRSNNNGDGDVKLVR